MKLCNIITCLVIVAALFGGCSRNEIKQPEPRHYHEEVRSVNKLVLAQMTISKMATIDDLRLEDAEGMRQVVDAVLDASKIGSRKAAYSYNTYLRAYMDMSSLAEADLKVDDINHTITVNLPKIQTEFAGRDMQVKEEHYRVTGLRSQIGAAERAAVKEQMNSALKKEVEQKNGFREKLVAEARVKAESYFQSLLATDGYKVVVNFK